MTSRILREVGEMSRTKTLNCRFISFHLLLSSLSLWRLSGLHSNLSMRLSCTLHGHSPREEASSRHPHDVGCSRQWGYAQRCTAKVAWEIGHFPSSLSLRGKNSR